MMKPVPTSLFAAAQSCAKRGFTLNHTVAQMTRLYATTLVTMHGGDINAAAQIAGVSPKLMSQLWREALRH